MKNINKRSQIININRSSQKLGFDQKIFFIEYLILGLLFFSVSLLFSTNLQVHFTLPKLAALRTCTFLLLLVWFYRLKRGELQHIPNFILYSGLALGVWWLFTTPIAVHKPTALDGFYGRYNGLFTHEIFLLLFFITSSMEADTTRIKRILKILLAALLPVSIYAILQHYNIDFISWPKDRPASTIGHPVILAALLGLGLPFIITFLIQKTSNIQRILWGIIFTIFLFAIILTLSRGPWIGVFVSVSIILLAALKDRMENPKRIIAIVFLFCVLISAVIALKHDGGYKVLSRLKSFADLKSDISVKGRFTYYTTALEVIKDYPITGIGFENFRIVYPQYRPAGEDEFYQDVIPTMVHNGYLQTAVTNGIPGLLLYLVFLTGIFVLLIKTYRSTTDRQKRFLLIAFFASITGYLVQDIFGWLDIALTPFFWIMLGLSVSFCISDNQQVSLSQSKRKMLIIFASLCSIFLIYLIVDAAKKIHADNLFWKSHALSVTNDWNQIEQNISKALQVVPGDFYYKDMGGLLYTKRLNQVGDIEAYKKGVALFDEAYTGNPFDPGILIHRIDSDTIALLNGLIKINSGIEIYATKLLAMDKNNPSVYEAIARLRLAQNDPEDALETLTNAKVLGIKAERYYLLEGDIKRAMKNNEGAIDSYRKVIAILDNKGLRTSHWKSAKYGAVLSLIDAGNFNDALKDINEVIAYYPSDVLSYIFKGDIYGHLKNYERARESFQEALRIEPSNPYARRGYKGAENLLGK